MELVSSSAAVTSIHDDFEARCFIFIKVGACDAIWCFGVIYGHVIVKYKTQVLTASARKIFMFPKDLLGTFMTVDKFVINSANIYYQQ